jgi:Chalcone isomerase-like
MHLFTKTLASALLCAAVLTAHLPAAAQSLPATTAQLAGTSLHGQARLRVIVHVYDAGLYVTPGFSATHLFAQPFALTIVAGRAFKSASIMRQMVKEFKRLDLPEAQLASYESLLAKAMPDVEESDALTGVYTPAKGWALSLNGKPLGQWNDDAFAKAFFNIFLGDNASQNGVRDALLKR